MTPPVDPARYAAWLGVMTVMVVTPGPANLFAIATGARRGRRAVLAAVAGMNLATLVWIAASGLGLAALAISLPAAFRVLALVGAVYVAWLGLRALWAAAGVQPTVGAADPALGPGMNRASFRQGFLIQLSNPKALLFTTVILPPFLDPARPIPAQIVVLAGTTVLGDIVAMTAYGFGGATLAQRMNEPCFRRGFSVFTGLLLLTAALLIGLRA